MTKPDKIIMSSSLPNYIQIATYSTSMTVSGTVAAGGGVGTFTASIPITRSNSRYDVYALNNTASLKQLLNTTNRLIVYLSSGGGETWSSSLTYSTTAITFNLYITNNTGSPITLTTQSFTISAVEYRTPF